MAGGAWWVSLGILGSRLSGLVRQKLFAHAFGTSLDADVFNAAMRIPNILQNLLGEGVLSASFIPVYARLRAEGRHREADALASGLFSVLALLVASLVFLGVVFAEPAIALLAPGFEGEARRLAVRLVQLLFPGTGLLVFSAWCLGVLNSHRRFLLSYLSPVAWNASIIVAILIATTWGVQAPIVWTCGGVVVGSLLQFVVQLPATLRLLGHFRPGIPAENASLRTVLRGFVPAVGTRGVVQLSSYVDLRFATLIGPSVVSALSYAQQIALLPVSLFGMALSAAELPELSASSARREVVSERLSTSLSRLSFLVLPSAVALAAMGDCVAALLLESGRFSSQDSTLVHALLAAAALGLVPQTFGRMLSSTWYALGDTRTPFRFAVVRVALSIAGAWFSVSVLAEGVGLTPGATASLLVVSGGAAAGLEMLLSWRGLKRQREVAVAGVVFFRPLCAAVGAAGVAQVLRMLWREDLSGEPLLEGLLRGPAQARPFWAVASLALFAATYGILSLMLRVPEAQRLLHAIRRRLPLGRR